mmetsp:Transcript_21888/g.24442  ORF Transcript_21888/g.24442 Transcript_21888/m.24442 type:complete len:316 (-) Transcript_21888:976-1923(-)
MICNNAGRLNSTGGCVCLQFFTGTQCENNLADVLGPHTMMYFQIVGAILWGSLLFMLVPMIIIQRPRCQYISGLQFSSIFAAIAVRLVWLGIDPYSQKGVMPPIIDAVLQAMGVSLVFAAWLLMMAQFSSALYILYDYKFKIFKVLRTLLMGLCLIIAGTEITIYVLHVTATQDTFLWGIDYGIVAFFIGACLLLGAAIGAKVLRIPRNFRKSAQVTGILQRVWTFLLLGGVMATIEIISVILLAERANLGIFSSQGLKEDTRAKFIMQCIIRSVEWALCALIALLKFWRLKKTRSHQNVDNYHSIYTDHTTLSQ